MGADDQQTSGHAGAGRERRRSPGQLRRAAAWAAAALAGGVAACEHPPAPVGTSGVQAVYDWGALTAELPPRYDVLTVTAAAEVALRERGYSITHKATSSDTAALTAKGATVGAIAPLDVVITQTAAGTGIRVKQGAFGDEVGSRVILEAILAKLGL